MRIISKFARKRYRSIDHRGVLPGKRHISERPKDVESRLRIGHWEGDTVSVLTLVERKTGLAIFKKPASRSMAEINEAAMVVISEHRKRFKTITFDNGTEFHDYQAIEHVHPVKCYFAPLSLAGEGLRPELQRTASAVLPQGNEHEQSHAG